MSKIAGSCLCGAVKYTSASEPVMTAVCHCENCQRQSGTAFSIIVGIPEKSLDFSGEENISSYMDHGEGGGKVERKFCKNCGSPLISEVASVPGLEFLKAGTLDDKSWLKPNVHLWCDSMQPWVKIEDGVQTHGKNPT